MTSQDEKQSKAKSPPKYRPGELPVPKEDAYGELQQLYVFNPQQIQFLKELQKDCDVDAALKRAGYRPRTKEKFLDNSTPLGQAMLREIREIQNCWMKAIHLNAASAAKKHLEILEKVEKDYDVTDHKSSNKAGLAATLARLSDTSLKATGHFMNTERGGGTKVEINIDLSSNKEPKIDQATVIDNE